MAPTAPPRDFVPYPFEFRRHAPPAPAVVRSDTQHPVVIVGGGIAGLTLALNLAAQDIRSVVLEADATVCFGSRADLLLASQPGNLRAHRRAEPILAKGLPWTGGRSYQRNTEVLHFQMPHDADAEAARR